MWAFRWDQRIMEVSGIQERCCYAQGEKFEYINNLPRPSCVLQGIQFSRVMRADTMS